MLHVPLATDHILGRISGVATAVVQRAFVDSRWPHLLWHCHRLPDRSFFVRGRQLHVCARCTGIACGFVVAFPLAMSHWRYLIPAGATAAAILVTDGGTQYFGWRQSNNLLRCITGFAAGALIPAALVSLGALI